MPTIHMTRSMNLFRTMPLLAIGIATPSVTQAQTVAPTKAHNVVLVHGAWADGSSWSEVISRLQAAGLNVTAVQNPLTSLEDSAAATRRELALQDGPRFWSLIHGPAP
jgi:hypothetical protein